MFVSIATTHRPATDLGFLVHKNPSRVHTLDLAFGRAILFFPEAREDRCELVLTLDVDPVGLVRGGGESGGLFDQYVNDRPYAASSLLSVALARGLREALSGRSRERQALAETPIPLDVRVTPLPVRGPVALVERLFEPLGYTTEVETHLLDPKRPDWGVAPYVTLRLSGQKRLSELLSHLYVLMPVLDDRKHYFVGEDELEKLLLRGEGWLADHPERETIVSRYLKRRRPLVRAALAQLSESESDPQLVETAQEKDAAEAAIERPVRLHELRLDRVTELVAASGAKRVLDLGCGEGKLIAKLLRVPSIQEIVGVEVSSQELAHAERRFEDLPDLQRKRLRLIQGSLIYRDIRLRGYDAAALVEVIEHLESDRLPHLERALFADARPKLILVTTPNRDYNVLFPSLPAGRFRHADHRFEWSRAEFIDWATRVAADNGYVATFEGLGEADETLGPPGQMAVFSR